MRIPRRPALPLLAFTTVAVWACLSEGDTTASGSDPPSIPIVEDLRIDGYEEDLVPVQWLGATSTGQLAVVLWQDFMVRFYSRDGELLGSVGREGDGPGEFRRLVRAGWIGDTLWVSDTQLRRSTLISPDLEVVRIVRDHATASPKPGDTASTGYLGPLPWAMLPNGGILTHAIQTADGEFIRSSAGGTPVLRVSSDGFVENVVARLSRNDGGSVMVGNIGTTIPFFPQPQWTVSPHGTRVAVLTMHMDVPEPYMDMFVADDRGNTIAERRFPFVPEPIPVAVRDSVIHARAFSRHAATVSAELESALRGAVPTVYPPATDILIGTDDRIWIAMQPDAEGTRWLVLSPDGEPQGEVLLPPRVRLRNAGADYLLCTERDEFDVQSIVRYRVGREMMNEGR